MDRLLFKIGAGLLTYTIAALTLARRWAAKGDQRLWTEI